MSIKRKSGHKPAKDDFFSNLNNPQHIYSLTPIAPLTPNQKTMFELFGDGFDLFVHGYAGTGKRIWNEEKILTDSGWKRVGDVIMSDKLVAPDGSYTDIEGIFYQEQGTLYKVTFEDDCSLVVDGEHLWSVRSGSNGYRYVSEFVTKTTNELIQSLSKKRTSWYIPLIEATPGIKWSGADPYILGQLLGDGTMSGAHPTIYSCDDETREYLTERGWKAYKYREKIWMLQATNRDTRAGTEIISGKGVDKIIPAELLSADENTRLALLQGLMDSDGTVGKDGSCQFASVSEHLARGVQYLVRSLGGKSKVKLVHRVSLKGGVDFIWKVSVIHASKFMPFRLTRKSSRIKAQRGKYRKIVSIEQMSDGPATCFRVSHPSHLFVCQDFIVTHNTLLAMFLGLSDVLSGGNDRDKMIIVRSVVPSRDMGFLPGNAKEKAKIYELPYIDACTHLVPGKPNAYESMKAQGIIEFTTTSFLRGITFKNAIIYIDEIQNLADHEIHTVMTRIGDGCRVIVSGDIRQTDLQREGDRLGCATFIKTINLMPTFRNVEFGIEEILRSSFVKDYIVARAEVLDG